ncbi:MAG: two-component regulator propeller domain-containing protein [Candidatus Brocadiia bacterium]
MGIFSNKSWATILVVATCALALWIVPEVRGEITQADLNRVGEFVLDIHVDSAGRVWIGTEGNGLWRLDPEKNDQMGSGLRRFGRSDGLADNYVYAICSDRQGRIWVGHLRGGVSVYNGQSWKNYGPASGPLSGRVFDIACCPVTGQVWIATSAGLSRYCPKEKIWSYYGRWNGLPEDQIQTLAITGRGHILAGTQSSGLAIGRPAAAEIRWRTLEGPHRMPLKASGRGLPSGLINDILVGKDGTMYVATDTGLARRPARGSWSYVRGKDLPAKLSGMFLPGGWRGRRDVENLKKSLETGQSKLLLAEDYVCSLAEDERGRIWMGHRRRGVEVFDPKSGRIVARKLHPGRRGEAAEEEAEGNYVFSLACLPNGQALVGTYGEGLKLEMRSSGSHSPQPPRPAGTKQAAGEPADLPAEAEAFKAEKLDRIRRHLQSSVGPTGTRSVHYLGDDWQTQGDWMGRYGRQYAVLCAAGRLSDHIVRSSPDYQVEGRIGPHYAGEDSLRRWIHWLTSTDKRVTYDPLIGCRRQASWDDHGEAYAPEYEGPDLWVAIRVPEGRHRVSFYFVNKDGHRGRNRWRDYLLEFKRRRGTLARTHFTPPLVRTRVRDFWGGVYKNFLVRGPGRYLVRITDRWSFNTILSAVLIDRAGADADRDLPPWAPRLDLETALERASGRNPDLAAACRLWDTCRKWPGEERTPLARMLAYRSAVSAGAGPRLRRRWRWSLKLWTERDRMLHRRAMRRDWHRRQLANPHLRLRQHRPHSPNTYASAKRWEEMEAAETRR